jgi:ADP-ribose pyrophosphatase YjhB (NUDIX family)
MDRFEHKGTMPTLGFVHSSINMSGLVPTSSGLVSGQGDVYQQQILMRMAQRGINVAPIQLNNGFEMVPVYHIRPNRLLFSTEERERANLLDFTWTPKNAPNYSYPQRSPAITADNFALLKTKDMSEVCILLGRWTKSVNVYGRKQEVDGLVLAGGGNMERMGNKRGFRDPWGSSISKPFEDGHMTLRQCADAELSEEIGVDPRLVRATVELGSVDFALGDPRLHCYRGGIFLRWIEQQPKATAELKKIVAIPISQIRMLTSGQHKWKFADKEVGLELGHDWLIDTILTMPTTQAFIQAINDYHASPPSVYQTTGSAAQVFQ